MLSVVAFLFLGPFCAEAGNVQEISSERKRCCEVV